MQLLTPTGYKDISTCSVGDEVSAFDIATGAPIINTIESLQWVDATEWARWWQVEPIVPPFQFHRINGTWTLNSEQSVWRNADNVCHVRDLVLGDVVFDDTNANVTITSIEEIVADGWWRFDISGDHSYIADGLTLHNASRFWVLGTASWTAVNTANWASVTNGAGGQTVPGSADAVTFDASSGGGVVTVNFGGTITVQSITCGAFTGTLDFSANNNNVTLTASPGMVGSGAGTRTINLGNGTWTLSAITGNAWNFSTTTGLTFNANSSTIVFSGVGSTTPTFIGGGLTYSTLTINANSGRGGVIIAAANTFANLNVAGPNSVQLPSSSTTTITNALNFTGTAANPIGILCNSFNFSSTISVASGSPAMAWTAIRAIAFTGGATFTATNSFDLGSNTGITITAPSTGGGGLAPAPIVIARGTPY